MPARHEAVALDRVFSAAEMVRIRQGVIPSQMEDKWFVYWHDNALSFHRSWTGICIYVVHFVPEGESCRMVRATRNRDPDEVNEGESQHDAMVSYLIDVLLLHEDAEFPSTESNEMRRAMEGWSIMGRASIGEHPSD